MVYREIGEAGLTTGIRAERAGDETHLARSVGGIVCLAHKGSVDEEFEVTAAGNDEQGIFLPARRDGITRCILDEIDVLSAGARVMAAEEELTLIIDFEIVELIGIGAENQSCIAAGKQGNIYLYGYIVEGLSIEFAWLQVICRRDNHMICTLTEDAVGAIIGPVVARIAAQIIFQQRNDEQQHADSHQPGNQETVPWAASAASTCHCRTLYGVSGSRWGALWC